MSTDGRPFELAKEQRDTAFEDARVANLIAFADLTPDQELQWLTEMLET